MSILLIFSAGPVAATAHVSFTSMSDGDKMTVARRWFAEAMGMGPGGEKHVEVVRHANIVTIIFL